MRARWWLGGLAALGVSSSAHAHGGRPQTLDVLVAPDDPSLLFVPATFGTLRSTDGGAHWESLCYEAMPDARPGSIRPFALGPSGLVLVAQEWGLLTSDRAGCDWAYRNEPLRDSFVADVVPSGDGYLVLSSVSSHENHLYFTTDGVELAALPTALPTSYLPDRVRVAPSDPSRIVISGSVRTSGVAAVDGRVYVSSDGGATFLPADVTLANDERRLRLFAIDPVDPSHAFAVAMAPTHDRVIELFDLGTAALVVRDVSTIPAAANATDRPFGLAYATDHSVWFGNTSDGLSRYVPVGRDETPVIESIDKFINVACLVPVGDELYVCTDGFPDMMGDGAAVMIQSTTAPYARRDFLRLEDVARPARCCAASDATCAAYFTELLRDFGRYDELDGGIDAAVIACEPDAGAAFDGGVSIDVEGGLVDASSSVPDDADTVPPTLDAASSAADAGSVVSPTGCGCRAIGATDPTGATGATTASSLSVAVLLSLLARADRGRRRRARETRRG